MVTLAIAGLLVAGYVTLVQLGAIARVWDPIFGPHSTRAGIDLTRPVPDALAGVLVYATEIVFLLARRGRLLLGLVFSADGLTSIALVVIQPPWSAPGTRSASAPPRSRSFCSRSGAEMPPMPSRGCAGPGTGSVPCLRS